MIRPTRNAILGSMAAIRFRERADEVTGAKRAGTLRVLIVENGGLQAAGLKAQLQSLGHEVVGWVRDGREAVTSGLKLEPDLIITALRLPVMDGIEAARAILTHKLIPIILFTAYAADDLVRRAREAGVMAYLVKPVHGRQLRSTIEAALTRFGELQTVCDEVSDLREALETRKLVEQAKGVLMKSLNLSEAEAFRRIQEHRRRAGRSFKEAASAILKVEELLFRKLDVTRRLRVILDAVRPGLR